MTKKLKRAFGLIRVSTSEQDMQSQKDRLKSIAQSMGYSIADEREGHDFFSEKISGFDEEYDFDRESIVQLEKQITIQRPDAIFCLELSRLTRTAIKVSHYIDMLSVIPKIPMYFADFNVWTCNPETLERNHDDIMTLYGAAASVENERKRIRERTMRGRDAKAEKGYYVGHLKDGYKWEYNENKEKVIVRDKQRDGMIKTIFELYLNKDYSIAEIRDYLNSRKYPTANKYRYEHPDLFKGYKREYRDRSGNIYSREDVIWSDGMVSGVLKDEWYVGVRRYHGVEYPIEPIVNKDVWDGCQRKLKEKRTNVSTAKHTYLLGGLMYCGVCGKKMYGHNDGGYGDMYYCSSYEYGKSNRCGLRWVRRQNMEAIVMEIVKRRVYTDITLGVQSPFSDFFSIDKTKLKDIEDKIRTYKSLIKKATEDIETHNKSMDFLIVQQSKYPNDTEWVARYDRAIANENKEIKERRREILDYEVSINGLKKQKKILASVKEKLVEIRNLDDYTKAKSLIQSVIQRIVLYNSDKTTTIIRIEYVNGKVDTAIYNPIRMSKKFIVLSMDEWNIDRHFGYDVETKKIVFKGCYLACRNTAMTLFDESEEEETPMEKEIRMTEGGVRFGKWNTLENKERFVNEMMVMGVSKDDAIGVYENAVKDGVIWNNIEDAIKHYEAEGCVVFKDEISVLDYIKYKKDTSICVFPYADLLPMSERGERIRKYHQEYDKRRRTGKTFEPFVVKDADYEQICKERKRLYNRIDKIKHKKRLTQEEKDQQIFRIREQLEAYRSRVKYLPTNKKGKDLIKKYGNRADNQNN